MPLLAPDEPPAFESLAGTVADRIIFVCDHASNRVPGQLASLGLRREQLDAHIGWDIGAAAVARGLQARFDAAAVLANYSRLVVDLNRSLADPSAFPVISDGLLISGNLHLDAADRAARAEVLYAPYHDEIERHIAAALRPSSVPVFLGIHSFTPNYHGTRRIWDVGVLWDKDPRLALPMLRNLRTVPGICVGDNEPYSGRHPADYSIDHHAERRGLAHVGIEIRQDLIMDSSGQERWVGLIAAALESALAMPGVFEPRSPHARG